MLHCIVPSLKKESKHPGCVSIVVGLVVDNQAAKQHRQQNLDAVCSLTSSNLHTLLAADDGQAVLAAAISSSLETKWSVALSWRPTTAAGGGAGQELSWRHRPGQS